MNDPLQKNEARYVTAESRYCVLTLPLTFELVMEPSHTYRTLATPVGKGALHVIGYQITLQHLQYHLDLLRAYP